MANNKPNPFAAASARRKEEQKEIIDKAKGVEISEKPEIEEPKASTPKAPAKTQSSKKASAPTKESPKKAEKNKGGRPKTRTEDVKIANIAIPESIYSDMSEYALALYNGNMTAYINALIKNDLENNLKTYKTVCSAMKKAKGGK